MPAGQKRGSSALGWGPVPVPVGQKRGSSALGTLFEHEHEHEDVDEDVDVDDGARGSGGRLDPRAGVGAAAGIPPDSIRYSRNIRRGAVSGRTMRGARGTSRGASAAWRTACALGALVLGAPMLGASGVAAQARTGFEATVHGDGALRAGRTTRVLGRAFEVRGLARLRPLPGATVRLRWVSRVEGVEPGPWVEGEADARGDFALGVAVPAHAADPSELELEVGEGEAHRTLRVPVHVTPAELLLLQTDRRFYEPGETVHAWVLARDAATRRPLPNTPLQIVLGSSGLGRAGRDVRTGPSGAAHVTFPLPPGHPATTLQVRARVGHGEESGSHRASATQTVQVGRRTRDRLLVTLDWPETQVPPGARFHPKVEVTAPSGAPARDARVFLHVQGAETLQARTDADGVARFDARAPAYLIAETGLVGVRAEIMHAAHGTAEARRSLRLAAPLALRVETAVQGGAIVPEVPSTLLLRIADAAGDPPAEDTAVTITGPGLRRPLTRGTDENGLVELDVRVPPGAVAPHEGHLGCARGPAAFWDVSIAGPRARVLRVCAPVALDAQVRPVAGRPLAEPGEPLEVRLLRRPAARRARVLVYVANGAGVAASTVLGPGETRARFPLPDALGLHHVVARPLAEPGAEVAGGVEAMDLLLVRPARPAFVEARPTAPLYPVGGTAAVEVDTQAGAGPGWLAVDVRDLAQHGGERPFRAHPFARRWRRALLEADDDVSRRLLRTTLAQLASSGTPLHPSAPLLDDFGRATSASPGRRAEGVDLRDPFVVARELERRGVAPVLRGVERALANAADPAALVAGEGPRRRFHPEVVARAMPDLELRTLGGAPITLAALQDAVPELTFERVARRVARLRLVRALTALSDALDPARGGSLLDEPPERWISRLVQAGQLAPLDLRDPWGGALGLRPRPRGVPSLSRRAPELTLAYPGPDGRLGTGDDVVDPFARVVPAGTVYAVASGEDELMRALALIAPGEAALQAMLEAFTRMTAAMQEALIADATIAGATEGLAGNLIGDALGVGGLGLGGIGHGGGGGSGSGYGRGRASRVPRIRTGRASVSGGMPGSLSGLVREEFPGTLLFLPHVPVDDDGRTTVEIPLADAATTYLVEIIHWRADGWLWSTKTRVRADQELVVDAPVPRWATEGDALELLLRAANRGARPRTVQLRVEAEGLALEAREPAPLDVPPEDARAARVRLAPPVGEGHLVVTGRSGDLADGTRRPLGVLPDARRATIWREALIDGTGEVALELPEDARPRAGGAVVVRTGRAAFGSGVLWDGWEAARRGAPGAEAVWRAGEWLVPWREATSRRAGVFEAYAFATAWRDARALPRAVARRLLGALTPDAPPSSEQEALRAALTLHALAPVAAHLEAREELAAPARHLLATLRQHVEESAARRSEAPALQAAAALALATTVQDEERAREHLRRARRAVVRFGEEAWLQARALGSQNVAASAILALAEAEVGERSEAFAIVRTLVARALRPTRRDPSSLVQGLASLAAARLVGAPLERVRVVLDGEAHEVPLDGGRGVLEAPGLDRPGRHVARVESADARPIHVRMRAEYGAPWRASEPCAAPLALEVARTHPEGDSALRVGGFATWEVRVRNLRPRTLARTYVEVELPTGAELEPSSYAALEQRSRGRPTLHRKTLQIPLRPLLPGREVRLPLRVRWTVPGALRAFGVAAFPETRPDQVAVHPPETITVLPPEGS